MELFRFIFKNFLKLSKILFILYIIAFFLFFFIGWNIHEDLIPMGNEDFTPLFTKSLFNLLICKIFLIEYSPSILFISLFIWSSRLKKLNVFIFFEIKGFPIHKFFLSLSFYFCIFFSLLFSGYTSFVFPEILKKNLYGIQENIFEKVINNPELYLKNNTMTQIGNYYIYLKDISLEKKGWYIKDVTIFRFSSNSREMIVSNIFKCNKISFNKNKDTFLLKQCLFMELNKFSKFIKGKVFDKDKILDKYLTKYQQERYIFFYPKFIYKYAYSTLNILNFILNDPCPWRFYDFLDRLFYFLSFLFYSFTGVLFGIMIPRQTNYFFNSILILLVGILLPFLGGYFQISSSLTFMILYLTYTAPLVFSIIFILILFVRRKLVPWML